MISMRFMAVKTGCSTAIYCELRYGAMCDECPLQPCSLGRQTVDKLLLSKCDSIDDKIWMIGRPYMGLLKLCLERLWRRVLWCDVYTREQEVSSLSSAGRGTADGSRYRSP